MTRIIDFGVVKLYCVRLSKWYVYAREGYPDEIHLKSAKSAASAKIRDSDSSAKLKLTSEREHGMI